MKITYNETNTYPGQPHFLLSLECFHCPSLSLLCTKKRKTKWATEKNHRDLFNLGGFKRTKQTKNYCECLLESGTKTSVCRGFCLCSKRESDLASFISDQPKTSRLFFPTRVRFGSSLLLLQPAEWNWCHVLFLELLPSSMLAPADDSSMYLLSSSVSSSSPLCPRRFQWDPGFLPHREQR